jgi:hypothetical protein
VRVDNFRIGGVPADPRMLPGFPPQYSPYFGPGGGGVMIDLAAGEPTCAARVDTEREQRQVYKADWRY